MSEVTISNNGQALTTVHMEDNQAHLTEEEKALISSGMIAMKSDVTETVISVAGWSGSSAPYTQVLSVPEVKANSIVEVSVASSATEDQISEFGSLMLRDGGQTDGSITFKAMGTLNTSDIPITIIVRGDT